jgi:coenzyme PQQ biosynthesis protein PqqD
MNDGVAPKFGKGVKLRHDSDGSAMLLVPEGALVLNSPAAVALELVDGKRTLREIVEAVVERFEVEQPQARADLSALFDRLRERGFIQTPFETHAAPAPADDTR